MNIRLLQAVVSKGDQFGTVVLFITDEMNGFAQYVPTFANPQQLKAFETPTEAANAYKAALDTFDNFGWSIIFNGPPNNAPLS